MMNSMNLLFYLRKSQDARKPGTLKLRVTLNGVRVFDHSLAFYLSAEEWDEKTKLAKGSAKYIKDCNNSIQSIRDRLNAYHNRCLNQSNNIISAGMKQIILNPFSTGSFLEVFRNYMESVDFKSKTVLTRNSYQSRYKTIQAFLKKTKQLDLLCEDFNEEVMRCLQIYLSETCGEIYQVKMVQVVHYILKYAKKQGVIDLLPSQISRKSYTYRNSYKKQSIYLSSEELKKFSQSKLSSSKMEQIRDYFLFSCYTGLGYLEIQNFSESNLEECEGIKGYRINRNSSKQTTFLPIRREAELILERYKNSFRNFQPQQINLFLKAIALACGIEKSLTFRVARETFKTMAQ